MKVMLFDERWINAGSIPSFVLARFQQAFQFRQDQKLVTWALPWKSRPIPRSLRTRHGVAKTLNGKFKVYALDFPAAPRTDSALCANELILRARSAGLSLICSTSKVTSMPDF